MTDITARNRSNRRKGANWQSDLLGWLRARGLDVEQLHLTGREDEGDLVIRWLGLGYEVIEAKNEQRIDLAGYMAELAVEKENFRAHRGLEASEVSGVAIIKRRGKPIEDAYVVMRLGDYFPLTSDLEEADAA